MLPSPAVLPTDPPSSVPAKAALRIQALRWLLDDLLDAEQDLLELLSSPTAMPAEQRQWLMAFCEQIGRTAARTPSLAEVRND
jgi:hypothetical protein